MEHAMLSTVWKSCVCCVLWCICKYGVGTVTYVEGNINWDKYIDILDNTL